MLLLAAFVIVFYDDNGQLLFLEVQLGDLGPEKQTYFLLILEDQYAGRSQTQRVLASILPLMK